MYVIYVRLNGALSIGETQSDLGPVFNSYSTVWLGNIDIHWINNDTGTLGYFESNPHVRHCIILLLAINLERLSKHATSTNMLFPWLNNLHISLKIIKPLIQRYKYMLHMVHIINYNVIIIKNCIVTYVVSYCESIFHSRKTFFPEKIQNKKNSKKMGKKPKIRYKSSNV